VPTQLKLALAQINVTVGDIDANAAKVADWIERARRSGADAVLFPELCIPGYPAEDLYLKPHFLSANVAALERIAAGVHGITAFVGFAEPTATAAVRRADAPAPKLAYNSLAVLAEGRVQGVYRKQRLPNYAVFDEERYFMRGGEPQLVDVAGTRVGLTICEDVWEPGPPASEAVAAGAELIVNASGSPYHRGKALRRERMFAQRAREHGTPFAFCNLIGGQDELVFDGASFVVGANGALLARARQFEEDLLLVALGQGESENRVEPLLGPTEEVYRALVLGLRDYLGKNGFEHAVVALSGGIDSALVAQIAADALGSERLTCVLMPSPHSSQETQEDARAIARNLGAELIEIPIADLMRAYDEALGPELARGVAAENLQARIRGNLVMALSNAHGWLVLTTGNKSEMSVGYATLYGDMAGGFAVIKDVPKTLVYELVAWRNAQGERPSVPESVLRRPPSAELRPGQLDSDTLPPYPVLDRILAEYVERDRSRDELVAEGLDPQLVDRVLAMVDRAEYKRRQAPPGIRITPRAFGRDRRLPITNRFRG
jgi:NAD+ synthase (glutamine-hydrolysing)